MFTFEFTYSYIIWTRSPRRYDTWEDAMTNAAIFAKESFDRGHYMAIRFVHVRRT